MNQKNQAINIRASSNITSNCGSSCVATVPHTSQIDAEYNQLAEATAVLSKLAEIHIDRIGKVLRQESPQKIDGEAIQARDELCILADAIRAVRLQIENVNARLGSATNRVEL